MIYVLCSAEKVNRYERNIPAYFQVAKSLTRLADTYGTGYSGGHDIFDPLAERERILGVLTFFI